MTAIPDLAVVGAGPAGLIAAERVAAAGHSVHVFDRMPGPARKFLLAGKSGLNITHAEPPDIFAGRYGEHAGFFRDCLAGFSPDDLRAWVHGLGVETFVGSSGRVFPVTMKASVLVRAWLRRLEGLGVVLRPRHRWTGWDADGALLFERPDGSALTVRPRATLLALGGASWPRTGSDGAWTGILAARGVELAPFRPSNMGFAVGWSDVFAERFAGHPVKSVVLSFNERRLKGEFVITRSGIEGSAVYVLSTALRDALERDGHASLTLDLKPDLTEEAVLDRLRKRRAADSMTNALRKTLRLPDVAMALLREGTGPEVFRDPVRLARSIKALDLPLTASAPIDRAISSAGGVRFAELDDRLMLRRLPGMFVAGEMLDWEAPTGGYLLQGCFATGVRAAEGILARLAE
ncbi:TIGR03862 family flavoprotein [Azospirillum sp. RWY-5-1]|uniref:TIGR03862 family flavoprotein n=1 Tax=Azospirillum oleiclasticum TaxID=2735135 RepID=A0ABX2TDY2_9PROT|nr:TIGR03862 family flavoprotein [Azospirillum oleiclasticum]NYZ14639.1 TIGR03862 family flavoprotein [Azospirillum oleiclasticum]NYZ22374.1 TIGR03862 family flavoprotein [Azospirillum oleiclasticum]